MKLRKLWNAKRSVQLGKYWKNISWDAFLVLVGLVCHTEEEKPGVLFCPSLCLSNNATIFWSVFEEKKTYAPRICQLCCEQRDLMRKLPLLPLLLSIHSIVFHAFAIIATCCCCCLVGVSPFASNRRSSVTPCCNVLLGREEQHTRTEERWISSHQPPPCCVRWGCDYNEMIEAPNSANGVAEFGASVIPKANNYCSLALSKACQTRKPC